VAIPCYARNLDGETRPTSCSPHAIFPDIEREREREREREMNFTSKDTTLVLFFTNW
jgi:hypothetical protein